MSAFFKIASIADRMGLRRLVAGAASLAYAGQHFEVDASDRWVNSQREATFVSPTLHTAKYSEVEQAVLDNWAWDYMPREGDTVIDVGAGVGEEAVVFSRLVGPTGRVISIEAHPATFACLQATIERSRLTNVTPLHCAVADTDGEMSISSGDNHLMNTVVGGSGGDRVRAMTLDMIGAELGLDEVALLKMNIEGAEVMAIEGLARVAARVRHAAISCHDFVTDYFGGDEQYRTKEKVRAQLEAFGFTVRSRPDASESWVRDYLYASR